ncbi:MAG: hypothetical protein Q8L65_04410, partial [Burkholderiales bacterium]|nr:hypothetical protein [Burkholderiales bacterium]
EIAAEKIMSLRSVRRFFTTHRAEAIRLARMTQSIPERRKLLAELVGIYGPEIAKLSAVKCDAIFRLREGLSVSETLEFDRAIEFLIIGQKA